MPPSTPKWRRVWRSVDVSSVVIFRGDPRGVSALVIPSDNFRFLSTSQRIRIAVGAAVARRLSAARATPCPAVRRVAKGIKLSGDETAPAISRLARSGSNETNPSYRECRLEAVMFQSCQSRESCAAAVNRSIAMRGTFFRMTASKRFAAAKPRAGTTPNVPPHAGIRACRDRRGNRGPCRGG